MTANAPDRKIAELQNSLWTGEMRGPDVDCGELVKSSSARLYDRLERALIALEYALADARSCEKSASFELDPFVRSQDALQSAGEDLHLILAALKSAGLQGAAERANHWMWERALTP